MAESQSAYPIFDPLASRFIHVRFTRLFVLMAENAKGKKGKDIRPRRRTCPGGEYKGERVQRGPRAYVKRAKSDRADVKGEVASDVIHNRENDSAPTPIKLEPCYAKALR